MNGNPFAVRNNCSIEVVKADIATLDVDAIVNSANYGLAIGGGVSGAIHSLAGPKLFEECRSILDQFGMLSTSAAVITGAGNLRARHVIHAITPKYRDNPVFASVPLANTYYNVLQVAAAHKINSIAIPCLGTGTYGFPDDVACDIAVETVMDHLKYRGAPQTVVFCVYSEEDFLRYGHKIAEVPA